MSLWKDHDIAGPFLGEAKIKLYLYWYGFNAKQNNQKYSNHLKIPCER
jgi:hypothetical protein